MEYLIGITISITGRFKNTLIPESINSTSDCRRQGILESSLSAVECSDYFKNHSVYSKE